MSEFFGTAIIGYGGMGRGYHRKWLNGPTLGAKGFRLCGIWDIDPERCRLAEEEDGVHAYASEEELLADENVKMIVAAVPNDQHFGVCTRAMKAGKGVICEKPCPMSSEELRLMRQCAEENGVVFTVHQNRRWDADFHTVKNAIASGALGEVYRIESKVYGSRGIPGDWRKLKACGGGMILDWGVHLLDQAQQYTKGKKLLSLYCETEYAHGGECDDGFTVTLKYEGGLTYFIEVKTNNYIEAPRWYVAGKDGTLILENWNCDGRIVHKVCEIDDAAPIQAATGLTKTMAPRTKESIETIPLQVAKTDVSEFYINVRAAIEDGAELIVKPWEVAETTEIMEAMFRSAEENIVIKEFKFQQ